MSVSKKGGSQRKFEWSVTPTSTGWFGHVQEFSKEGHPGAELTTAYFHKRKTAIDDIRFMANRLGWCVDWKTQQRID